MIGMIALALLCYLVIWIPCRNAARLEKEKKSANPRDNRNR